MKKIENNFAVTGFVAKDAEVRQFTNHKCRTFPAGSGPSGEERRRYQAYIRFHEH